MLMMSANLKSLLAAHFHTIVQYVEDHLDSIYLIKISLMPNIVCLLLCSTNLDVHLHIFFLILVCRYPTNRHIIE